MVSVEGLLSLKLCVVSRGWLGCMRGTCTGSLTGGEVVGCWTFRADWLEMGGGTFRRGTALEVGDWFVRTNLVDDSLVFSISVQ